MDIIFEYVNNPLIFLFLEDESRNEKLEFILPKRKKTPHQRTIYQCDKCQKQFGLKRNFMHHINSHLGIKPYACTQCDKRFVQRCHMNTHMKILHSGLKPYICHKCGKSFAVSSNLKKHAATHGREEVFFYVLNFCLKVTFRRRRNFK